MDPEVSVLLHCAPSQGLGEHHIQIEISTRFNRRSVPEIEQHIEAVWNNRVAKEPWLFNGAKFRLHSAELSTASIPSISTKSVVDGEVTQILNSDMAQSETQPACHKHEEASLTPVLSSSTNEKRNPSEHQVVLNLQLGLTCYKDFLGTNWSQEAVSIQQRGQEELGDPKAFLAQPLGVGAVLVTSDGQVVLLRRSQKVAEAAGLLDIPGGHPEPKAVCQGVSEEAINVDLMQGCERAVVAELFSSVCAEIRDERLPPQCLFHLLNLGKCFRKPQPRRFSPQAIRLLNSLMGRLGAHFTSCCINKVNVPLSFLGAPVLMGIALNHTSAGRPSAEFYTRCSLTMAAVKDFYWLGGPEAHESTDIVFLSRAEMLRLDENAPLWSELCPSAKGAVLLYQLVRPDRV